MSTTSTPADSSLDNETVSKLITFLLAVACGLIVANLYYAQPLVGPISASLGLSPEAAGLIVTMAQMGYVAGLLLIVPLGDLFENRNLVLCVIGVAAVALFGAALSTQPLPFLFAALLIGLGSVAVQILIPYAAHLAPEAARGRVVGDVTTGLMIGIMLARPASSFIASISSWHVVYVFSGTVMVVLAIVLFCALPRRTPKAQIRYGALLASMGLLFMTTPILRRRALLPGVPVRGVQPVLDHDPLVAGRSGIPHVPARYRIVCARWCRGADRRSISGSRLEPCRDWCCDVDLGVGLCADSRRRSGLDDVSRAIGRSRYPSGFRRAGKCRSRLSRPVHARCGISQPSQRPLYGDILPGRCSRLGRRGLGVCAGRMGTCLVRRSRASGGGADLFCD